MKKETIKALSELAKAAARSQGMDENNIEFSVCNTTEPETHAEDCTCDVCYDDSECWLCSCGEYIEDGCHCSTCGAEPPWGCPCSFCQDGDEDDYDDEVSYSDVMREDWDY